MSSQDTTLFLFVALVGSKHTTQCIRYALKIRDRAAFRAAFLLYRLFLFQYAFTHFRHTATLQAHKHQHEQQQQTYFGIPLHVGIYNLVPLLKGPNASPGSSIHICSSPTPMVMVTVRDSGLVHMIMGPCNHVPLGTNHVTSAVAMGTS